jgi:ubiquinone/menaquinone biosynthesis C-methylase UbiE
MTTPEELDALTNVDSFSRIPERIVPGLTDRAETADHMARYGFAATGARGMTLDLGSGVGYGAAIIAAAPSVQFLIAFDISSRPLAFGRSSYGETISFAAGDAGALPLSKDPLDSVVCLEAIEHVAAEWVLREIARVLRPEGIPIISTPTNGRPHLCICDGSTLTTSWNGTQEASRSWSRGTSRLRRYSANPGIRSGSRGKRYAAMRGPV